MKILKFKTNIDKEDGVKAVAPYLDKEASISRWNIDTAHSENILSVSGEELEPHTVRIQVEKAGFKVEAVRVQGIGGGDL